jgi:hypothetical protein|tara:strand:+ start:4315 stop:4572 length:258 start_codon:yes stop_codon:yes gene_type:complete
MSETQELKLNPGDSALIIRHEQEEKDGFGIEIYHHPDDRLSEEDVVFYALLTRGMAYSATQDVQSLLEMGEESYGDEEDIVLTQH